MGRSRDDERLAKHPMTTYTRKYSRKYTSKYTDNYTSSYIGKSPVWRILILISLCGGFAVNSLADFSNRRQIIVFSTPASESGKHVQHLVDTLRCQLIERDTDVRFVDVTELPGGNTAPTGTQGTLVELARLRSNQQTDFEVVLIGKDGGVKARTSDPDALQDFLTLIDTMPMRRAEIRSRDRSHDNGDDGCE